MFLWGLSDFRYRHSCQGTKERRKGFVEEDGKPECIPLVKDLNLNTNASAYAGLESLASAWNDESIKVFRIQSVEHIRTA
jgi:hypothetical protein